MMENKIKPYEIYTALMTIKWCVKESLNVIYAR